MIARLLAAAGVWMIAESVSRAILGRLAMVIDEMTPTVSTTIDTGQSLLLAFVQPSSRLAFVVVADRRCFFQLATSKLPYR